MGPTADRARSIGAIDETLRHLAPRGVATGSRRIDAGDEATLHGDELAAIASAAPRRRREFATGRALLRELLGWDVAIPARGDRRPAVPDGWVASLAHDVHTVVAALAPASLAVALGIDIEPIAVLDPDVAQLVVRPDDRVADPLVGFVLKEAAYKAWSTTGGRMLEHHDVRLDADPADPGGAAFTATVLPDGVELVGRYASVADVWVALVVVAASSATQAQ